MLVERQALLQQLESVQAGLASKEVVEQSSCFIFQRKRVTTFNDRVMCSIVCDIGCEGAVASAPLLAMLTKFPDDTVDLSQTSSHLVVKGAHRKSEIRMETEVLMDLSSMEKPDSWQPVHEDFAEAVDMVGQCAAADDKTFSLTCVHLHPEYLEACDNFQMTRFPIPTGVQRSTIVPQSSLKAVVGKDMVWVCETPTWLYFQNDAKLRIALRRYNDEFIDLDPVLARVGGVPTTLPGGMAEVVDRAEYFSKENADNNQVLVELRQDRIRITGVGSLGKYEEMKKIKYGGEPIAFLISPKILAALTERHNECEVVPQTEDRPGLLRVDTGRFVYVSCLGRVEA